MELLMNAEVAAQRKRLRTWERSAPSPRGRRYRRQLRRSIRPPRRRGDRESAADGGQIVYTVHWRPRPASERASPTRRSGTAAACSRYWVGQQVTVGPVVRRPRLGLSPTTVMGPVPTNVQAISLERRSDRYGDTPL
jgi:hypothetical protein